MKRIYILLLFISAFLLCGCNKVNYDKNNGIVTSISVSKDADKYNYSFGIINPSKKSGEEEASNDSLVIKNITSENLNSAFKKLENMSGRLDLDHISLFCFDRNYLNSIIKADIETFIENTRVISLIKCFVSDSNSDKILKTISENFGSNSQDFIDSIYFGNKKNNLCTLSELYFSLKTPSYNVIIPSLNLDSVNKSINQDSSVIYNKINGLCELKGNDNDIINNYFKSNEKNSSDLSINVNNETISVKLKNKADSKTIDVIENYAKKGFDVLNTRYYVKKSFKDYTSYENYISNNDIIVKLER